MPYCAGQRVVDEGVIRGQQLRDIAIPQQHAVQEQAHFGLEIAAHGRIELRIQRLDLGERGHVQPRECEVLNQRLGARILEHALDLRLHDRRIGDLMLGGETAQLLIRALIPQKERQTRGEFQIVQLPGLTRR